MRSGRFVLLSGIVAVLAVTAFSWARTRRAPPAEPPSSSAAAPDPGASAPLPAAAPAAAPARPAAAVAPPAPPPVAPPAPRALVPARADQAAAARIDALVRAGDIGRARDAAEEFLRLYPDSSYCQHIETLTGVHPRPPIPGE
jgi:TolA-binding protein